MISLNGEPVVSPPSARVGQAQPMLYRQGIILDWNPLTLENRVRVDGPDGPIFENLPVLGTAEAATYGPGAIVGIATVGQSWAIVGRFVTPGTPEAATALDFLGFFARSASVIDLDPVTSTSYGDLAHVGPAVTVHIGPSGKALVILTAEQFCNQPAGAIYMSFEVTGANSLSPDDGKTLKLGLSGTNTNIDSEHRASSIVYLDASVLDTPGETTFTAKYRRSSSGVGANAVTASRNITVLPL